MISLKDMPFITVEQLVRFRAASLRIESERDEAIALMKWATGCVNGPSKLHEAEREFLKQAEV